MDYFKRIIVKLEDEITNIKEQYFQMDGSEESVIEEFKIAQVKIKQIEDIIDLIEETLEDETTLF